MPRPLGPGAEIEASRGCPYSCTFCAKENFRDRYRRRERRRGAGGGRRGCRRRASEYVYFIDEIFLPNRPLLEGLSGRGLKFGVQTRIDLWKPEMLELLGRAGCVSIEAGVESLTRRGATSWRRTASSTTEELADRLLQARRHVPFVQANLLEMPQDDADAGRRPGATGCARRRVGQRPGAAVPVPGLARTTAASGACRTTWPGSARSTITSPPSRDAQRSAGRGAQAAWRELEAVPDA